MDYLSRATLSNPAILWVACRWLEQAGSSSLPELSRALRPSVIVSGKNDQLVASLDVGKDIGIVGLEEKSKKYVLEPNYPDSSFSSYDRFITYLRTTLLEKAVHDIESEKRPSDLALGLAWLNTLDPMLPLGWTWNDGTETTVKNTGQMSSVIVNSDQWLPFRRWAIALGFGYEIKITSGKTSKFIADPTQALLGVLSGYEDSKLRAAEFINRLSNALPCLPSGTIGKYLRTLDVDIATRGDTTLCLQLGYVLEKLSKRGLITLIEADDARNRLSYSFGDQTKTFDYIELGKTNV